MCKGIEAYELKRDVTNTISLLRDLGMTGDQIAERVAKKFDVSIDYVKNLMMPKAV